MLQRLGLLMHRVPVPTTSWLLIPVATALIIEVCLHLYSYQVPIPDHELDTPFAAKCQEPDVSAPRENAVLVMLARNSELEKAKLAVESVERVFNRWYNYPIVFLNDEPWSNEFVAQLNATSSGPATFEVIPESSWGFPEWIDVGSARQAMAEQGKKGIPYAGREGYHHMCRFFSGHFYRLEALKDYKWYWRLEPDVEFSCSITYDPFVQMARHNKVYGFVNALWEVGTTCPSLFRTAADWMEAHGVRPTSLWKAIIEGSWAPSPFRMFLKFLAHRDRHGDVWSLCHYWSNFEIANMEFFRGQHYQQLFEHLDSNGGFYYERWGDAAVHSLAVAMLLDPQQIHHFKDFGYRHDHFYQCPANAPGGQLPDSEVLGQVSLPEGNSESEGGIGCRCQCDRRPSGEQNFPDYCSSRLKQPNSRQRPWFLWLIMDPDLRFMRLLVLGVVGACVFVAVRFWLSQWSMHIMFGIFMVLGLTSILRAVDIFYF